MLNNQGQLITAHDIAHHLEANQLPLVMGRFSRPAEEVHHLNGWEGPKGSMEKNPTKPGLNGAPEKRDPFKVQGFAGFFL